MSLLWSLLEGSNIPVYTTVGHRVEGASQNDDQLFTIRCAIGWTKYCIFGKTFVRQSYAVTALTFRRLMSTIVDVPHR